MADFSTAALRTANILLVEPSVALKS
ncbi:hypothetical protein AGR2A_pa60180 [Agrobacterium genomosp. 2 str. CFBP 5494]|uniref:Uncharacterized protein n=1 Tax=Agrobacterium genomosp. 2 str. CFBP 5494 TaxID=1183436 RepID=A0A9W5F2Z3_9HYPH|nr:hypothetical protein AGR2A_pa60180 [Agrobacterium genomosp. 2 str. CFBP 5494]